MKTTLWLSLFIAVIAPIAASAQGGSPNEPFLNIASASNKTEIAEAQYVMSHTTDPTATAYARRMLADHTQNQNHVQALADQLGVELTTGAPPQLQDEMNKLSQLSGRGLAHAYIAQEVGDHQVVIRSMMAARGQLSDKPVLDYIAMTLPVLQQHLQLAITDSKRV